MQAMKSKGTARVIQSRYSMNITPLIDVIFLLMIFFVMTINMQEGEGVLNNQLPQVGSPNSSEPSKDWETVKLRIKMIRENKTMKLYLQERVVYTYADLLFYLDQLPQDILIIIEPENNVPYKHVIGVYNQCLKSNKNKIVFSISE
jgi:biopolymer transport protein ExbD